MIDEVRTWWLDKLSVDENGWMDAIPHKHDDAEEYDSHIRVVEHIHLQKALEEIEELKKDHKFAAMTLHTNKVQAEVIGKLKAELSVANKQIELWKKDHSLVKSELEDANKRIQQLEIKLGKARKALKEIENPQCPVSPELGSKES